MKKMSAQAQEGVDVRTTLEMVRHSDQEKRGRTRYLYDVDFGDSALYDLMLNTEKLTVDAAVEVLTGLVRSLVATPESYQHVRDRALASRVRTALAAHPETRRYRLTVESDRGVIRLEGTAALERATEVARTVPGVVDVKSQLLEVPPIPPFVA